MPVNRSTRSRKTLSESDLRRIVRQEYKKLREGFESEGGTWSYTSNPPFVQLRGATGESADIWRNFTNATVDLMKICDEIFMDSESDEKMSVKDMALHVVNMACGDGGGY